MLHDIKMNTDSNISENRYTFRVADRRFSFYERFDVGEMGIHPFSTKKPKDLIFEVV